MKKEAAILFLLLTTITLASAIAEIKIQNEKIQPGETLFAKISLYDNEMIASPISVGDIQFLEGRKQLFIQRDLTFYNNTYYLYAYPSNEGNITIKIPNILYKNSQTGQISSSSIEKTIEIKKNINQISNSTINSTTNSTQNNTLNQTKILSIRPGFFVVSKSDSPEFILLNVGNTEMNVTYQDTTLTIKPQQSQKIIPKIQTDLEFQELKISSYKDFTIPIILLSTTKNQTTPTSQLKLKPSKDYIHINSLIGENKEEQIELFSFSDKNITNITISSSSEGIKIKNSDELTSTPILPRQSKNLTLTFDTADQGYFQGNITISFVPEETGEIQTLVIPIYEYVFPENTTIENVTISRDTCAQMGGISCNPLKEVCNTTEEYASDGFCCTSTCKPKPSDNPSNMSYGWLWGTLIFVALATVGYFIYKKFKKVQPKKVEEKFTEATNAYQKRVSGSLGRT